MAGLFISLDTTQGRVDTQESLASSEFAKMVLPYSHIIAFLPPYFLAVKCS